MKIGILGGTFDPPHIGHLIIAEKSYEQFNLDKLWIMPTGNPGYKGREDITDKTLRAEMVKAAIKDNEHFEFSDFEINREGIIYTYDTLNLLKEKYPDVHFYFIIGGDSLENFTKWYKFDEIFKLCTLIVSCRDDIINENLNLLVENLRNDYKADIQILDVPGIDISSSDIRKLCKEGKSFRYFVNENTYNFIKENKLYTN